MWPFNKQGLEIAEATTDNLEARSDSSYTDALIAVILSRAQGDSLAIPHATAALEACVGLVGRSFAAAEVQARPILAEALPPDCLEMVGRSLIRRGELVLLIDTAGGELTLTPAATVTVYGGPNPAEWLYTLTVGGPSHTMTYDHVPAASVLHFRYGADPERPWRGQGPIAIASLAGKLSAATVNALANEAGGPVGRILGVPKDGGDDTVSGLKADIGNAKGRLVLVESGDWGGAGAQQAQLDPARFGADPPPGLISASMQATHEVVAACGLHAALWGGLGGSAPAAATREAWRLALFSVLSPLGAKVSAELTAKLGDSVTLGWQELRASDLSGRARAFQSMVGGGMDIAKATALSGLMTPEERDD